MTLTINIEHDSFAHRRGHIIFGNAEKCSHVFSAHFMKHQEFSIVFRDCKQSRNIISETHATSLVGKPRRGGAASTGRGGSLSYPLSCCS